MVRAIGVLDRGDHDLLNLDAELQRGRQTGPTAFVPMDSHPFNLASILLGLSAAFVLATLFFGTKGGYYDTDDYDGNGTAH